MVGGLPLGVSKTLERFLSVLERVFQCKLFQGTITVHFVPPPLAQLSPTKQKRLKSFTKRKQGEGEGEEELEESEGMENVEVRKGRASSSAQTCVEQSNVIKTGQMCEKRKLVQINLTCVEPLKKRDVVTTE
jgi:hypothetical protein